MLFVYGGNDVFNVIGSLVVVLFMFYGSVIGGVEIVILIDVFVWGGFGIVVGLMMWGYSVMVIMGKKIMEFMLMSGFVVEFVVVFVVLIVLKLGLLILVIYMLVGVVMGVGFVSGFNSVSVEIVSEMVLFWVVMIFVGVFFLVFYMWILIKFLLYILWGMYMDMFSYVFWNNLFI